MLLPERALLLTLGALMISACGGGDRLRDQAIAALQIVAPGGEPGAERAALPCVQPERRAQALRCPAGSGAPARSVRPYRGHIPTTGRGADALKLPRRSVSEWRELEQEARRQVAEAQGGHQLCLYQARLAEASRGGRTKAEQVEVLRLALDQMDAFVAGDHPGEAEWECRRAMARVVLQRGAAWHVEAVGTDIRQGTLDAGTMEQALRLYQLALERFGDLDQVDVEGWPAAERPTRYRLSYWAAELLWQRELWTDCGPAFDRVVELDPRGEHLEDAAYAAVLCYNNQYQESHGNDWERPQRRAEGASPSRRLTAEERERRELERLRPRALSDAEQGMLAAYTRYVCFVPEGEDTVRILYRRARIFYEANQWEAAATIFGQIAFDHPGDEMAPYAANLYLDCLNALSRLHQERRGACREEIAEAIEAFQRDENLMRDEEFRSTVGQLQCGLLWRQAMAAVEAERHREAGDLFVQIYTGFRDECRSFADHDQCEVLALAADNYEADGRIGPAIQVRRRLFQECGDDSEYSREHGGDSPWAKRALFQIGNSYQGIVAYTKAATYYEDFARRYPAEAEAPEALGRATIFRLGLGQDDKALEDARLFRSRYQGQAGLAAKAASLELKVGAVFTRRAAWDAAVVHFEAWLERYGAIAPVDEVLEARVARGEALTALDAEDEGPGGALGATLARIDEGRPAVEERPARVDRYRALLGEGAADECLDRLVDTVAQARFLLGQRAAREGGAEGRSRAQAFFLKVLDEGSPPWAVAALSRLGDLELPPAWTQGPAPAAQAHYLRCTELAREAKVSSRWSRACEARLQEIDPRRFLLDDEIRAQPTLVYSPLATSTMITAARWREASESAEETH